MAQLDEKPGYFKPGQQQLSARALGLLHDSILRQIVPSPPITVDYYGDRVVIGLADSRPIGDSTGGGTVLDLIRITSEIPTVMLQGVTNPLFPGVLQSWDGTLLDFADSNPATSVYVREPNHAPDIQPGIHLCLLMGAASDNTSVYTVIWGPNYCIPILDSNCNPAFLRTRWGTSVSSTAFNPC